MVTFFEDADLVSTGEFVESEIWLATEFNVPAGTASFRWRWPAVTPLVTPTIRVYADDGVTLVAGPISFDTTTLSAWNYAGAGSPVTLAEGTYFVVVNTNRYVARTGFFSSGSIVRGVITANRSRFGSVGGSPAVPNLSAATYFIDIDHTPEGGDSITPDGLAVPVGLGAPSVNAGLSVSPSSLAIAVGQGALTVGQPTAAPSSLTVATALGQPAAGLAPSAPNGLSVPVGLGEPSVVTAYAVAPDGLSVATGLGAPAIVLTSAPADVAVLVGLGAPTVGQATGSGGWHDFGGIIQGAIEDARINAERRRNPVECPVHGWPLKKTVRGLHCQFGGHVVTGGY